MTIETTLADIFMWARNSHSYLDFKALIKMHYFNLPASAETPEIKVKLIIDEQKGETK